MGGMAAVYGSAAGGAIAEAVATRLVSESSVEGSVSGARPGGWLAGASRAMGNPMASVAGVLEWSGLDASVLGAGAGLATWQRWSAECGDGAPAGALQFVGRGWYEGDEAVVQEWLAGEWARMGPRGAEYLAVEHLREGAAWLWELATWAGEAPVGAVQYVYPLGV